MPGVAVVSVPVADQDRSIAFYTGHFDMKVLADAKMGPEMRWVQLGYGEGTCSLALTTWFGRLTAGMLEGLVLDVEDVDATRAGLVGAGVACTELDDQGWGRFFTCADPDGNGLVVAKVR